MIIIHANKEGIQALQEMVKMGLRDARWDITTSAGLLETLKNL